jgi:hypothetical protein
MIAIETFQIVNKTSPFHVLAAKYLKVLIPYLVVLVDGILAVFWYLKEYLLCLIVNKSCKYKGLVLWKIFNLSMAIVLRDRFCCQNME